jgi:hypothetical protein
MKDILEELDLQIKKQQEGRARTQITLGELMDVLMKYKDKGSYYVAATNPHSYRGFYSDIALEPDIMCPLDALVDRLTEVLDGETFGGYKGGDFTYNENTPVFIAVKGELGYPLIGLRLVEGIIQPVLGGNTVLDS